jgi:hypothetical protein
MTTARLAVRVFAVASPLAMGFAVVATANHFLLDVAGGVVVVIPTHRRPRSSGDGPSLADGGRQPASVTTVDGRLFSRARAVTALLT